jgi:hypothetical protein
MKTSKHALAVSRRFSREEPPAKAPLYLYLINLIPPLLDVHAAEVFAIARNAEKC